MKVEVSLPCSYNPTTGTHQVGSNAPIQASVSEIVSFLQVFERKISFICAISLCMLHFQSTSAFMSCLCENYLMKNANYRPPHYSFSCILLLFLLVQIQNILLNILFSNTFNLRARGCVSHAYKIISCNDSLFSYCKISQ